MKITDDVLNYALSLGLEVSVTDDKKYIIIQFKAGADVDLTFPIVFPNEPLCSLIIDKIKDHFKK